MAASTVLSTINSIPGKKAGSKNTGKSADSKRPTQLPTKCPECTSQRIWKDGLRYVKSETATIPLQRFICRDCGRRFSESNCAPAKSGMGSNFASRGDVSLFGTYLQPITRDYKAGSKLSSSTAGRDHRSGGREAANFPRICLRTEVERKVGPGRGQVWTLSQRTRMEKQAAGATTNPTETEVKGKILEVAWHLKKEGYSKSTIFSYPKYLRLLANYGANLYDPESVKDVIANRETWGNTSKLMAISAYTYFASMNAIPWNPPKYKAVKKLPFIPLEAEIDALIASAGKKLATTLQLIKETAMRIGEACKLTWIDIDLKCNTIVLNTPEKGGNPRMFKISNKLAAMLYALPKTSERVFGKMKSRDISSHLCRLRKRIAQKLQNPRLNYIHFHTLRHWKATTEYHKTKDILYVMKMLGHRNIQNTLIYTQLIKFESDEFHSAVAKDMDEARALVETGFEYVCAHEDAMLFRKRK